jgi:hypothetical protein
MYAQHNLKSILSAALLVSHFFVSASASDDSEVWKENVQGWSIYVDKTVDNGCFMATTFEGGTRLRAQFNPRADNFALVVANPSWESINPDKFYDLTVQFGNRTPWDGEASVLVFSNMNGLVLEVGDDEAIGEFVNELMRMTSVKISYRGEQIANLSLDGSYKAMEEVFACQAAMNAGGSTPEDPFSNESKSTDPFS